MNLVCLETVSIDNHRPGANSPDTLIEIIANERDRLTNKYPGCMILTLFEDGTLDLLAFVATGSEPHRLQLASVREE